MENQNPQSSEAASTFVKCLSCTKLVRLPADPDPNAMARCPRCGETYQIGELLDAEIPELEVLGGSATPTGPSIVSFETQGNGKPVETVPKDEQNRFVVAPALAKGAKRKKRRRSSSSSESKSSSSDKIVVKDTENSERKASSKSSRSSSGSSGSSSRSSSSSRRSSSRRKTPAKPDSGLVEGIKILFGALLAPPVAQLVIWWVLGLDPLGLGPTVSKFVPAVVPAKFRAETVEEPKADPEEKKKEDTDGELDDLLDRRRIPGEMPAPPRNIENPLFD